MDTSLTGGGDISDRGGAIHDNRLDMYMEHRADAIEFGVQHLEVIIRD